MQTDWNRKQKTARLEREIAHFTAQIERFLNPQNPREKAALTLSRRKLAQRQRIFDDLNGNILIKVLY